MSEAARTAGAIGACLSGAGPTVLALVTHADVPAVCRAMQETGRTAGIPGQCRHLPISPTGATLITE
jgi:homoserine kinase